MFLGGSITDCDGGLALSIEVGANLGVDNGFWANYADYVVTWPDGTVTTADNFEWVIPEPDVRKTPCSTAQQICVTIEDPTIATR